MKEFALKHPIITFLLVDSVITKLYNLAVGVITREELEYENSTLDDVVDIAGEVGKKTRKIIEETKEKDAEKEKLKFGFV